MKMCLPTRSYVDDMAEEKSDLRVHADERHSAPENQRLALPVSATTLSCCAGVPTLTRPTYSVCGGSGAAQR